jgi:hypothetical protein
MDLIFDISVIEKNTSGVLIYFLMTLAVVSKQQVQPTSQGATCRVNALLPANQNQAFLN